MDLMPHHGMDSSGSPRLPPVSSTPDPGRRKVIDLNACLTCVLCGGYYVDATTIVECLHSFCKSCIIRYLEFSKYCPVCDVLVHKTRPEINLRPDHTLQDLVYKLVPGLFTRELNHRREFLRRNAYKSETILPYPESPDKARSRHLYPEEEKISLSLEFSPDGKPVIDYTIEKDMSDMFPGRRYLLCPALFTVELLKRFIRLKFNIAAPFVVDIFHTDESLQNHYTLMDIAYIYTWQKTGPLRLFYSIYEPVIKPEVGLRYDDVITIDDTDALPADPPAISPLTSSSRVPVTSSSSRRTTASTSLGSSDTCSSDDSDDPDYNPKPGAKRPRKYRHTPTFTYETLSGDPASLGGGTFLGFQPLTVSTLSRGRKRRKVAAPKNFVQKYARPGRPPKNKVTIKTSPQKTPSTSTGVVQPSVSSALDLGACPVKEEPRDALDTSIGSSSTTSSSTSNSSSSSSSTSSSKASYDSTERSTESSSPNPETSTNPSSSPHSTSFTSSVGSPSSSGSALSPPRPAAKIKDEPLSPSSRVCPPPPPPPSRRLSSSDSSSDVTSGSGYYPVIRSIPVSINFQKMGVKVRALSRLTPEQRFKIFRPSSPTRRSRDLESISHVGGKGTAGHVGGERSHMGGAGTGGHVGEEERGHVGEEGGHVTVKEEPVSDDANNNKSSISSNNNNNNSNSKNNNSKKHNSNKPHSSASSHTNQNTKKKSANPDPTSTSESYTSSTSSSDDIDRKPSHLVPYHREDCVRYDHDLRGPSRDRRS